MAEMTLNEAIEHAKEVAKTSCGDCAKEHGRLAGWLEELVAFKRVAPTPADVRTVILCKDCVMYRRDKELAEASYLDPNYYCGLLQSEMPEDGFCSYGKRRGGDAE